MLLNKKIGVVVLGLCFAASAVAQTIKLPSEIKYTRDQGLLPLKDLAPYFDVELDVNKRDCLGKHTYIFGPMTIYRGAVDHKFRIAYKYETANVACFLTLISKSDQFKYKGKGWDQPWVEPRPDTQVWCISADPKDCEIVVR